MKNQFIGQVVLEGIRKAFRNPKYRGITIAASLLYLISPIDIIPDFIPVLGWIDDGAIATLLVAEVSQIIGEKLQNLKAKKTTGAGTVGQNPPGYQASYENINRENPREATVIDVEAVSVS